MGLKCLVKMNNFVPCGLPVKFLPLNPLIARLQVIQLIVAQLSMLQKLHKGISPASAASKYKQKGRLSIPVDFYCMAITQENDSQLSPKGVLCIADYANWAFISATHMPQLTPVTIHCSAEERANNLATAHKVSQGVRI